MPGPPTFIACNNESATSNESRRLERLGTRLHFPSSLPFLKLPSTFSPSSYPASIPLLDRLTLDSDGDSGGDSVVAIILDVTRVISAGATHDVW